MIGDVWTFSETEEKKKEGNQMKKKDINNRLIKEKLELLGHLSKNKVIIHLRE